jgi:membrane protease YdiL (CAAX protease family)
VTDVPTAAPGWYSDPASPSLQRYWDGATWTESTAPLVVADSATPDVEPDTGRRARQVYGQPSGTWGFGDVGWFVLATLATILASVLLAIPAVLIFREAFDADGAINAETAAGSWILTAAQGLFFAGMAAWPLIVAWRKSSGWRHAYGFVVSWRAIGIGLAGGVATLIAMVVLTNLTAKLLDQEVTSAGADAAESMTGSTVAFVIFLVLIAIGAPFVEELAFRGLVWGAAVKRGWSPWLATAIAGVPFALLHVEPLRVAPLLAAGIVLGVVRQYGGLSGAMLAHCVVNTIGVIGIATT